MDFDFSDDQKFLRDEARKFLEAQCDSGVVRKVLDNDNVHHSDELWTQIKEMGWLGTAIPGEYGGLGLGMLELCVIAEELGRVLAPVPFGSSIYFFAEGLKAFGSDAQKQEFLPKVADGSIVGCVGASEGPGPITAVSIKCEFDGSQVTGSKIPVTDGGIATHALLLVKEGSGTSLVIADLSADGVTSETLKTVEPTRDHAQLTFSAAPGERLGEAGQGIEMYQAILDRAAILLAFEQLGGASRAQEMAIEYAKERHAFGRPIGGNQAIKHKLADMYVKNEVARSNAYYGAWALSTDAAELPEAAAAARIAASEAFWFASKENTQTHGGMGFTWEVDCHLFYRRAKLLAVQAGAPAVWKEKLVRALEMKNAA